MKQFGDRTAWNAQAISSLADPLLIHAELQMSPDSRLRETAKRLFDAQNAPKAICVYH
ncbi:MULTISPECIES: hypothetical protein [Leptolyngbya]|uniref:hypothetical protein n=1 Tax=Leptolyngbya TaxID=47251 RepID=UPI001688DA68|nr:hypothetical protein [Leptolyngbya sp. FACHB-1624]MBD1854490.1 hypothetical protein [Leptolyngbya sp. FACHB-1624]